MPRIDILMKMYDKRQTCYADVRRFNSVDSILSRLASLDILLRSTPPKKRNNDKYTRLKMEKKLLAAKFEVCRRKERNESPKKRSLYIEDLLTATSQLRANETPQEQEANKMSHIMILLSILYSNYDDDTLENIVNKSNKYSG